MLHIVPSLSRSWGGPVTVVEHLAPVLSAQGVACTVLSVSSDGARADVVSIPGVPTTLLRTSVLGRLWTAHSYSAVSWLNEHIPEFDVVHIHELWNYLHHVGAKSAKRHKVPYVITPHGELGDWELSQKRLKKRLFMEFSQRKSLQKASAIQALTLNESIVIKKQKLTTPVRVIPNGVSQLDIKSGDAGRVEQLFRELSSGPRILFLGRLHIKKGVDLLFDVLQRVLMSHPSAILVVAGPEDDGSGSQSLRRFEQSEIAADRYRFVGRMTAEESRMALRLSDVYVQPSRSEGFSMSTLEAILEGTPAVVTRACNFDEIETRVAGKVVETNPIEIADAISLILGDPTVRGEMKANAIDLAAEYSWDAVAEQMAALYKSIVS